MRSAPARAVVPVLLACVVVLVAPVGPAAAGTVYRGNDKPDDACLAAAIVHPHSCGDDNPVPNAFNYDSLDIREVVYDASSGGALVVRAAMKGPVPVRPPDTVTRVAGATSALYRFFFTTPDGTQWCMNLHIGFVGRTAPDPVWTEVATVGRWATATKMCAGERAVTDVGGSYDVSGNTLSWTLPYPAFGGAAGDQLAGLGGLTDIGVGTGAGVRPLDVRPVTLRTNADIGPVDCDPSGLHGGPCPGVVTL